MADKIGYNQINITSIFWLLNFFKNAKTTDNMIQNTVYQEEQTKWGTNERSQLVERGDSSKIPGMDFTLFIVSLLDYKPTEGKLQV